MTAEIVIMNREAIALAADSAVTTTSGPNKKIFSTANKLFALSDIAPVGILVYGNALYMGIPWETVIKEYRQHLGSTTYDSLEEYYSKFCGFLKNETSTRIDKKTEDYYIESLIRRIFDEIHDEILNHTHESMKETAKETGVYDFNDVDDLKKQKMAVVINQYAERSRGIEGVIELPNNVRQESLKLIRKIRKEVFKNELSRGQARRLTTIGLRTLECFVSDFSKNPTFRSGIAIAGFGDKEYFPSISRFSVEGVISGQLKMREDVKTTKLDQGNASLIVSLAQTDMVHQFMEGISPEHVNYLHERMQLSIGGYADKFIALIKEITGLTNFDDLRKQLLKDLSRESETLMEDITRYSDDEFVFPIVTVVEYLPKEQLADMAESLVSLTALKRRVSNEDETVGGPIDVALITKGDGMIWIKRKHYFEPNLNPSYFERLSHRRTHHNTNGSADYDSKSDA